MLDRVDATSARHRNVHNDDVRLLVFIALIGRRSVAGLTDDRYPFVLCKERAVAFANDRVVVDNKDADCLPAHCRLASKTATSASTACASSVRAPLRRISVSGSAKVPGWQSWKTLASVTAYHSFGGEVEASSTPRY